MNIKIVKVPVDRWTEYHLAKKWYQMTKHAVRKSLDYTFGKHYKVQSIPILYLTNSSYSSCIQLSKVLYHYNELNQNSAYDHGNKIKERRTKNKQIIKDSFNDLKQQSSIKISHDDRFLDFLLDKSLRYESTFHNAKRVFDYFVASVVKKVSKLNRDDNVQNVAHIVFKTVGSKPSKHDRFDHRYSSPRIGFAGKITKRTYQKANQIQKEIRTINNIDIEAKKLHVDWKSWTKKSGGSKKAIVHLLTLRELRESQKQLNKDHVLRPLPDKEMYEHVLKENHE